MLFIYFRPRLTDRLGVAWGAVGHLKVRLNQLTLFLPEREASLSDLLCPKLCPNSSPLLSPNQAVADSKELREAVEAVQPERVALGLRIAQSEPLFRAFVALREGPAWAGLNEARAPLPPVVRS